MIPDYWLEGYNTYPQLTGKPPAGTQAEDLWSRGWSSAQQAEQCADQEWPFGRETFAADYSEKRI